MTGSIRTVRSLAASIKYESLFALRQNVPLTERLSFAALKIICVLGFFAGRSHPQPLRAETKRTSLEDLTSDTEKEASPESAPSDTANETTGNQQGNWMRPLTLRAKAKHRPILSQKNAQGAWFARHDHALGFHTWTTPVLHEQSATAPLSKLPTSLSVPLGESPRVAVVVPVYITDAAAADDVWDLVRSLQRQTWKPCQIVLVDDASAFPWFPRKAVCVDNCQASHLSVDELPDNLTVIGLEENMGPAYARNRGMALAIQKFRPQIIAFIDSDCVASKRWIEAMVQAQISMEEEKKSVSPLILSGNTVAYGSGVINRFHDHFGTLNGRLQIGAEGLLYGPSCNISVRVCPELAALGGFDDKYPAASFEDVDFCMRARETGFQIHLAPEATVWHKFKPGVWSLYRMFQKYGASEWAVVQKFPDYMAAFSASFHIPGRTVLQRQIAY